MKPTRLPLVAALIPLAALALAACGQKVTPPVTTPPTTDPPTGCTASASAQSLQTPAPRGVIVRYRSQAGAVQALSIGAQSLGSGHTVLLKTSDVSGTIARLQKDPAVLYAVPNVMLRALGTGSVLDTASTPVTPTDEFAPLQWAYPLLGYNAVWGDMQSHPYPNAVTVAVVDTGVRYDHPDLQGALYLPGDGALDLVPHCGSDGTDNGDGDGPDNNPTDPATPGRTEGSHGTHVTGIIAARWGTFPSPCAGCSTSGVVGATDTAPVKVLPIRVLDADGYGDEATIGLAIQYAAGVPITQGGVTYTNPHPAQVINLSLGGPISATQAQPMCDAVTAAVAKGALVFAAGGNDGGILPYYPAACTGAVAVAATTLGPDKTAAGVQHASYSNVYDQIALSAPGGVDPNHLTYYNGGTLNGKPFPDEIFSTSWNYVKNQPTYEAESGTSQATPQVSALAALMLSKGVTTSAKDTLDRLEQTATHLGDPGRNQQFGYGMINAAAALGLTSP